MKVFLDTNVLVSAFATRGLSADLVALLLAEHELVTGEINLAELRRVLRDRMRVPAGHIDAIEAFLRDQTIIPKPASPSILEIRDPDDAWVLASAENGKADMLVTGDQDLLTIRSAVPLPILTPRECWERLRAPAP